MRGDQATAKRGAPHGLARSLILVGTILVLSACQPLPSHRLLSKSEQAAIGTVDAVLMVPAQAPGVTATPSSSSGGGSLLGIFVAAAVDGYRSAKMRSDAAPIVAALQGFDFQAELLKALTEKLGEVPNMKVIVRPTIFQSGNPADAETAYAESTAPSVMLMTVGYEIRSGDLWLSLAMALYPKSDALKQFRPRPNDGQPLDKGNALLHITPVIKTDAVTAANIRAVVQDSIIRLAMAAAGLLGHSDPR
jgi:hypothetical protein